MRRSNLKRIVAAFGDVFFTAEMCAAVSCASLSSASLVGIREGLRFTQLSKIMFKLAQLSPPGNWPGRRDLFDLAREIGYFFFYS